MVFRFTLILLLGLVHTGMKAQKSSDIEKDYAYARGFMDRKEYSLAMEALKEFTQSYESSPLHPYALFNYAMAAYYQDKQALAKDMLRQLNEKYPQWEKMDEAYFWIGKINLEQDNYTAALDAFGKIRNPQIRSAAEKLKRKALTEIQDEEKIRQLYEQYPNVRAIARIYLRVLLAKPLSEQNRAEIENIIAQNNFSREEFLIVDKDEAVRKETYNVAVLFPFMLDENASDRYVKSNFVLDLFHGIQKAVDDLQEQNINIELFAYDTKRDSTTTAAILQKDELKAMDVLIGPLYPSASELVQEFSRDNRINMFNPLSNNAMVIGNNPYSFLYLPTNRTMAQKAAEFAKEAFVNKYAVIVYGPSSKDSLMAYEYKEEIEKDSFEIVWMNEVMPRESEAIPDYLAATIEDSDTLIIEEDSIGHVFVATEDDLIAANTIAAVEKRGDRIPIIGHASWLGYSFMEYAQLERLNVYLLAPNYIDLTTSKYKELKKRYIHKMHSKPSDYVFKGYDLMYFIGKMLDQHGTYFQLSFDEDSVFREALSMGLSYNYFNNNQFIPIIQFSDADIVIADAEIEAVKLIEEAEKRAKQREKEAKKALKEQENEQE